jgi:hypothetical protein
MNRISLLCNGEEILGISCNLERPKNSEEMIQLIRRLLEMMEAPTVPEDRDL